MRPSLRVWHTVQLQARTADGPALGVYARVVGLEADTELHVEGRVLRLYAKALVEHTGLGIDLCRGPQGPEKNEEQE
ncbi:MAG TPA: hypothetical protein PLV08_00490 [Flavobacteriales bacterium]|nr:hypothetical protein [Flavobacteriales bacterium]HQX98224.1 hypothetical protein [Flavobacteriales bacterium]